MKSSQATQVLAMPARPAILLVDDDEASQELSAAYAQHLGYATNACPSAEAALKRMREDFCPIVVTDLNMPGMGGLALCRELRSRRWPGYIYIIVLTGQDHEDGLVSALEAGADDYLRKGCEPAEVRARLRVAERIVTLEQRLRRTLENRARQAASDALTGLPNRRAFDKQLNAEFKRARRFCEALSLLLIDVDHFKSINDQHGHLVGDDVLRRLSAILRTHLPREFDILARCGGEEFGAVLPHTDRDGALIIAERLRSGLAREQIHTASGPLTVTVSIGIGSLSHRASTEQPTILDMLDEADRCLYESKRQGRNRVTAWPPAEPRRLNETSG
jgi:diguanylate cyclase (GGDEF)-like protein